MSPIRNRIYEHQTDAVIVEALKDPIVAATVLAGLSCEGAAVCEVIPQKDHYGSSGSIDVLAVLTDGTHLLIENKIDAAYSLTRDQLAQPERYRRSVAQLRETGTPALAILIAPKCYLSSTRSLGDFDRSLSYEALAEILSGDAQALLSEAASQASLPYEPIPSEANIRTFEAIYRLQEARFPELHLKGNRVRPRESVTVYVDTAKTLRVYSRAPKPSMSLQLRQTGAKIMLPKLALAADRLEATESMATMGARFVRAGGSLGIMLPTEQIHIDQPFETQADAAHRALLALDTLRHWWNNNPAEAQSIADKANQAVESGHA